MMEQNDIPAKIIFENEDTQRPQSFQAKKPKIIQWVINYSRGYIKDEEQAHHVLIGFVIVLFLAMFIILFNSGSDKAKIEAPPGQKIIYPENEPPHLQK